MLHENLCHCPACPWRGISQQLEERCNRLTSSNVVLEETQSYLVEKCKQLGQVSARRIAELESVLAQRRDSAAELELLRENLESLHAINTKYSLKEAECSRLNRELEEAERRETILLEQIEVLQSTLENVLAATEQAAREQVADTYRSPQEHRQPTHPRDSGPLPASVGPMMEAVLRLQRSAAPSDPSQQQAIHVANDFRDQFEQLQSEIRRLEDSHRSTTEAVLAAAERSARILESREQEEQNREREWKDRTQQLYKQSRTAPAPTSGQPSLPHPNQEPLSSTTTVYVPLPTHSDGERVTDIDDGNHFALNEGSPAGGYRTHDIHLKMEESPLPPAAAPVKKLMLKVPPTSNNSEGAVLQFQAPIPIPVSAPQPAGDEPVHHPPTLPLPPMMRKALPDPCDAQPPAAAPVKKLMLKMPVAGPDDTTAQQPPAAPPVKKLMLKLPPAPSGESVQAPANAPAKKLMLKLPPAPTAADGSQAPAPVPVKKLMLKLPQAPSDTDSAQPPAPAPVKKLMLKLPPKPPVS